MSHEASVPATRVLQLQDAFDRTFAEAPRADAVPQEDFLAITIGSEPYAMRLSDIGGLHLVRTITALPGSVPALLGLVGLRGALIPVYDLGSMLGYSRAAAPRWFAVIADTQVAVGFEQFDAHVRVPSDAVAPAARGSAATRPLVRESLHADGAVRPIIHLPSVLDAVAAMARHAARPKE
jgi:purine-binding chemotaxis protein CheW